MNKGKVIGCNRDRITCRHERTYAFDNKCCPCPVKRYERRHKQSTSTSSEFDNPHTYVQESLLLTKLPLSLLQHVNNLNWIPLYIKRILIK